MFPTKITPKKDYAHKRARLARRRFVTALYETEIKNKFSFIRMLVEHSETKEQKLVGIASSKEYKQWCAENEEWICVRVYAEVALAKFWLNAWSRKSNFNEDL